MQIRQTLKKGIKILMEEEIPSPELTAETLLIHNLNCSRTHLYSHPEECLSQNTFNKYISDIKKRASGIPTQYVVGHQEFWGLKFVVNHDVLIPRPETEHIVEKVLECIDTSGIPRDQPLQIVDVGTGSGCIALALAHELPQAMILACELSTKALHVATLNADQLKMKHRVKFIKGNLLAPILKKGFGSSMDFVVSNPPYIGREELENLQPEVRDQEPQLALGGHKACEAIYRRLIPEAHEVLKSGAPLILEIGSNMEEVIVSSFGKGWTIPEVNKDLQGLPRVVSAYKQEDENCPPLGNRCYD